MPELTTDEKPKSSEQIDLDEAEDALAAKDYKTARELLEKLGKICRFTISNNEFFFFIGFIVKLEVKADDEESLRIKEVSILSLGKVFQETKDAKGIKIVFD